MKGSRATGTKKFRRIGLVAKVGSAPALRLARSLEAALRRRGRRVQYDTETAEALSRKDGVSRDRIARLCDLVMVVGGDGTLLSVARGAPSRTPLLGINVGLLGFLTGLSREEALRRLDEVLEGKFRERILAALRIDKDYLDGAPQVVWGRYFFKLPWPKRDVGQATKVLTEAVRTHPNNARAKLYLADCYSDSDKLEEGTKLVQQVLSAPPGSDPPEDRRLRKKARDWLEAHGPPNTAQ